MMFKHNACLICILIKFITFCSFFSKYLESPPRNLRLFPDKPPSRTFFGQYLKSPPHRGNAPADPRELVTPLEMRCMFRAIQIFFILGKCWQYTGKIASGELWCYTGEEANKWASCNCHNECPSATQCVSPQLRGDDVCNGKMCGCFKKFCWRYLALDAKVGDEWCYSQKLGFNFGAKEYANCGEDKDCHLGMSCGSEATFRGSDVPDPFGAL